MPKATTKKADKPIEELTYEEALAELESIVEVLESEQNPLEEAMKLFERGQELIKKCGASLESAQLKIQKLAGESLIPFEEDEE
jgi:exodeoxyribonuclease VII small subunit